MSRSYNEDTELICSQCGDSSYMTSDEDSTYFRCTGCGFTGTASVFIDPEDDDGYMGEGVDEGCSECGNGGCFRCEPHRFITGVTHN